MFEITEEKKTEVWAHMFALPKSIRPRGLSDTSFERIKFQVWDDADFWRAVIGGSGINLITPDELKAHEAVLYEGLISKFFQLLYQIATESRPTKPNTKF